MVKKTVLLLMLAALAAGCATETEPKYVREGVTYGVTADGVFRGRWWSYYERGVSFLSGEFYDEAESDMRRALAGRSRDTWRARTYGLHFVEYFPNRELGVSYYQLGRLDEAEQYLLASLEQVDTARGHHYLDLVKKAKIAQGSITDAVEPEVALTLAKTEIKATMDVAFEIAANDDIGVAYVTVNGEKLHQRGSAEEIVFEKQLVLEEGTHEIEVVATDLAEKQVIEKVEVIVDLTGPTIGIFSPIEPTVTDRDTVILEGATVDKNGVVTVTIGERLVAESPGAPRLEFNNELPLGDGENTFVLAATDVAGNETRTAVKVFRGDPNSVEAKLWLIEQKYPEKLKLALSGAVPLDLLLSATPEAGNHIRLKSPLLDSGKPYRHSRTLTISGEVVTQTRVASLTINGDPFDALTGAPKESFRRSIPISEDELIAGKKSISIQATDEAGDSFGESWDVTIQAVDLDTPESRMAIAVLAFGGPGIPAEISDPLRAQTEGQLVNRERFRVVERAQLEDVLTEQQLVAALGDPKEAFALGKIIPAQVFLIGEVFERDQTGLEVMVRAVHTETTEILSQLDVFIEDRNSLDALKAGSANLAKQLEAAFPRVSGQVISVREQGGTQKIMVNLTKDDGIRVGSYLVLVHKLPDETDPDTGEVIWLGDAIMVGTARVDQVRATGSMATVVPQEGEEGITLEKGMPAITM